MYLCIYDIMSILIQVPFIGTLAKVRKAAIIFIFSVYQFVSPQWNKLYSLLTYSMEQSPF